MINEEVDYYTEEGSSDLSNPINSRGSQYIEEEEEEFGGTRYRKDQIFSEIDFTRRKTKIACTLGPSLKTISDVIQLIDAGMTLARLNMSHGNSKSNMKLLNLFIEAKRLRPHKTVALMLDIKGREIRISPNDNELMFMADDVITIKNDDPTAISNNECIFVDCDAFHKVLRPTDLIFFEGGLRAEVIDVEDDVVKARFKESSKVPLSACSQVRVAGPKYELIPLLQPLDIQELKDFYKMYPFEYVNLPCVQSGKDLQEFKLAIGQTVGSKIQICAKIDTPEALHQFDSILQHADCINIIREDLMLELEAEKLILAQKWICQKSIACAKPVFIQSQVIPVMVNEESKESRQASSDISCATLDGVDIFVLTHETSVGSDPSGATIQTAKAITEAERIFDHKEAYTSAKEDIKAMGKKAPMTEILCSQAMELALENKVAMMVVITDSGHIVRLLARQRPQATILACSVNSNTVRQVNSCRGVIGYKVPAHLKQHGEKLIALVLKVAREQGICSPDHKVMIFKVDNEGEQKESVQFKILEVGHGE